MEAHDKLLEQAKEAVTALFSDKSVPQTTTKESLREIQDDIAVMVETLAGAE